MKIFNKIILAKIWSFYKKHIVPITLCLFIIVLLIKLNTLYGSNKALTSQISSYDEKNHVTTTISYDKDFSDLKKENKELYDSLKKQKDKIDFLLKFKYKKSLSTDTVFVEKEKETIVYEVDKKTGASTELKEKVYSYSNEEDNDTLQYKLQIASKTEPDWYKLDVTVKDEFTIVNKSVENANETTIKTTGDASISDITVYQPKEKHNFWKRFSVGPQVGVGYGCATNKFDVYVGLGVSFSIFRK